MKTLYRLHQEQARQGIEKQRQMLENDPEFLQHKKDVGHRNMTKNWQSEEYRKILKPTQIKNGKATAQKNKLRQRCDTLSHDR